MTTTSIPSASWGGVVILFKIFPPRSRATNPRFVSVVDPSLQSRTRLSARWQRSVMSHPATALLPHFFCVARLPFLTWLAQVFLRNRGNDR